MGKVATPLLGFSASGKIADTLVYFTWKGLSVVRQHVIPANPKTADQVAQRGKFSAAVGSYRNYFTSAETRAAWNRFATASPKVQSGFNAFVSQCIPLSKLAPGRTMSNGAAAIAAMKAEVTMLNIDDGEPADEAGNFEVWVGSTQTNLLLTGTKTISDGKITTDALGLSGAVVFIKIRKDNIDRSGISKLTLIT